MYVNCIPKQTRPYNWAVNSLKYGYSVIQIRNTMHYGIDSSNLNIRLARLQRQFEP